MVYIVEKYNSTYNIIIKKDNISFDKDLLEYIKHKYPNKNIQFIDENIDILDESIKKGFYLQHDGTNNIKLYEKYITTSVGYIWNSLIPQFKVLTEFIIVENRPQFESFIPDIEYSSYNNLSFVVNGSILNKKDIIKKLVNPEKYDEIMVFSSSDFTQNKYQNIFPNSNVIKEFDIERIRNFVIDVDHEKFIKKCLIIDNSVKVSVNSQSLADIFSHPCIGSVNIFIMISEFTNISYCLSSITKYILLSNGSNKYKNNKLYKNFGTKLFNSSTEFNDLLHNLTNNDDIMVINNKSRKINKFHIH